MNHKNQVHAIKIIDPKSDDGYLFYRTGVTQDNLRGTGWVSIIMVIFKIKIFIKNQLI